MTKVNSEILAKPRVLLSAYACEPNRGSEPGVGWNVALGMAQYAEVTVLTKANNKEVIVAALEKISGPKPEFIYYDLPNWVVWLKRKFSLVAVYYIAWQIFGRIAVRKRLSEFDLIHHVTFNGFQFPGFWLGVDCPVVLGPLGGGMVYPPAFIDSMIAGRRAEKMRSLAVKFFFYNPITRLLLRSADQVLAANQETADLLQGMIGSPVSVMLETAYQTDQVRKIPEKKVNESAEIRALWIGGLMARKAPQIAIEAVREVRKKGGRVTLDIVGSGELRKYLERTMEEGDQEWLTFEGQVPHQKINEFFSRADFLLFTSLRDTSGNVVLEAMANGLPVIVPDHQGVAQICSADHALMIPVESPNQLVGDFTRAVLKFANNPELRREMGKASQERLLEKWGWAAYCGKMDKVYRNCLSRDDRHRPSDADTQTQILHLSSKIQ